MNLDPEPWEIAAAREHGVRDGVAILLLGLGAAVLAILPPARLVALTALRLTAATVLAAGAMVTGGLLAKALAFGAHGFLLLAVFSIAAHVEAATFGPIVDRLTGKEAKP